MTRPTVNTRKPIDQLTASDLLVFPIWEFAIDEEGVDGQDETWIRPVDVRTIPLERWSLSVAADFRTSSGVSIPGIVTVTTADAIELSQAVLLPDGGYIFVDLSDASARSLTAARLGLLEQDAFPLNFTLRLRIGREQDFRTGSFG